DGQVGRRGSARGIGADGDSTLVDEADDALGLSRTNTGLVEGLADLGESDSTLLAGLLEEVLDRRGQAGVTGSAGNRGSAHGSSSPPRALVGAGFLSVDAEPEEQVDDRFAFVTCQ